VSYSDGSRDLRRQIGCIALGHFGSAFVVMMGFGAALGSGSPPGTPEHEHEELNRFLMFPGSLIILILIGIFAAWHVTKDRD
jgi:hypothetical protein